MITIARISSRQRNIREQDPVYSENIMVFPEFIVITKLLISFLLFFPIDRVLCSFPSIRHKPLEPL